jgi:hypothetical protein
LWFKGEARDLGGKRRRERDEEDGLVYAGL